MTDLGRVALIGGHGFLGWHTAVRLRALHGVEPLRLGRVEASSPSVLADHLDGVDSIFHLAGVNRGDSDLAVEQGNLQAADVLSAALGMLARPLHVVYANSIQSRYDHAYGRGKAGSAVRLAKAMARTGGTLADVRLPNIFGEHGRPNYNSVVATFCHSVATGGIPEVNRAGEIPLLHAQDAAAALIAAGERRRNHQVEPAAPSRNVGFLIDRIKSFHDVYARGELPSLPDKFSVDLFNTYRSFLFPAQFPIHPVVHSDPRGGLFEAFRSHGGTGMGYVSTTRPGRRRGDHYHLNKIERFLVVSGDSEIALRRLYHNEVIRFRVSGDHPGFIDMPTMWVHNITNVGHGELVTMFWADQLFDDSNPDQFSEDVERTSGGSE